MTEACFARQSVYLDSVISHHSGMSSAVHLQDFLKVAVRLHYKDIELLGKPRHWTNTYTDGEMTSGRHWYIHAWRSELQWTGLEQRRKTTDWPAWGCSTTSTTAMWT